MKKILFLCFVLVAVACGAQTGNMTMASFNIRYNNPADADQGNGWERRAPVVCDLICFHDFEVFGAQEVLHNQLLDLLNGLPDYDYVGVGRDDGQTKGESSPIFFLKEKFEVIESGHFWLSDITDR
nr:endonuclease [Sunxiuqinia sp.]